MCPPGHGVKEARMQPRIYRPGAFPALRTCPRHQQLRKQALLRTDLLDSPSAKIIAQALPREEQCLSTHEDHQEAPAPSVDSAVQTHFMHRAPQAQHLPCKDHHEVHDIPAIPQVGALVKDKAQRDDFDPSLEAEDADEIGLRVILRSTEQGHHCPDAPARAPSPAMTPTDSVLSARAWVLSARLP